MPIYEYTCAGCGARFEELVRSAAHEAELTCPQCGQAHPQRQMSVPAAPQMAAERSMPLPGCGQCGQQAGGCPFNQG